MPAVCPWLSTVWVSSTTWPNGGGDPSVQASRIDYVFDELARLDDGGLLGLMSESLRQERAAAARRMVALGVLTQRRVIDADPDRQFWCIDDREALAGEVGAELGIRRGRASAEMSYGETLVTKLPKLAERFLAGGVDVRVITTIDYRTHLVKDSEDRKSVV